TEFIKFIALKMGDRYLFAHKGTVEEVHLPGKAILTFTVQGEPQRALLWIKCFIHQGKLLEQNDTFFGKLNAGDKICFDCHVYDRESKDNCGWYAPKAWKEVPGEAPPPIPPRIMNQTGYIFELDPGKGVIQFDLNEQEQRVLFLRSKFYNFGKRPGNKHTLSEFLSENDPVQFDAEMCEATLENKMCHWLASLVWKGRKPVGSTPWQLGASGLDELTAEDSASNADREADDDSEFPALSLPPGLTERQGYKAYEASNTPREGIGNVVALINEECGIALWMVRQNTWETVFFHRKNSYLVDTCLSKFDLQESLIAG
ncbi:hypothetical protein Anas_10658, partial [Armadillidium nasatum]